MDEVVLVGAGPGDPGLITVKGLEYVKNADVIIYDRLVSTGILDHAKKGCELIYAGKGNTEGGNQQKLINEILIKKAGENKLVVRLKGGDPFLFGRGGEEAECLIENGFFFDVVPGITSAIAVPAYAGIPVTHRDFSSSLHIFTGHKKYDGTDAPLLDFETIAKLEGTLVFLMGVENLNRIIGGLIGGGMDINTGVCVISNGTTSTQKMVAGKLENICRLVYDAGMVPPAVTIIGKVTGLAGRYSGKSKKPLFGKNMLVTRALDQSHLFGGKLADLGAEVTYMPFIGINSREFVMPALQEYEAVIFNSANAVRHFIERVHDLRILHGLLIGVIGKGTSLELEKYRLKADFMPEKFIVEEAVKKSSEYVGKGGKILVVTSDISPFDEKRSSEKYGIEFERLEVYETKKIKRSAEEMSSIMNGRPDVITFLSSSAVDSFCESAVRIEIEFLKKTVVASIGPETTRTIERHGFKVGIEAAEYTADGLVEAIEKYYGGSHEEISHT
jgi:uroporphyrinogen III methyltransferase / synthase